MRLKFHYIFYSASFFFGAFFTSLFYNVEKSSLPPERSIFLPDPDKFHLKLLILVISRPQNVEKRQTIRATWGSDALRRDSVKLIFAIGEEGLSNDAKLKLFKEQVSHGDLVFLPMEDRYENLTKKLLFSLKIVYKEALFEYLMKCDDDTYVNLPMFLKALGGFNNKFLLWGYFSGKSRVKTEGKWKEDGWFLCDRYLPYPLGGGYVVGRGIVQFIVNNHHLLSLYKNEDVSMGLWTSSINITRFHDIRFATEHRSRGCMNDYLVLHKKSSTEMKDMFDNARKTGVICSNEHLYFLPYSYNWSTLPSECCSIPH